MNKREANISLLTITFFAGIQYAFISRLPAEASNYVYLTAASLIGLLIMLLAFFGELRRADGRQMVRSAILAVELFGFNIFLLLGAKGTETSVTAFVSAAYIVFVPPLMIPFHRRVAANCILGMAVVLVGLTLAIGVQAGRGVSVKLLYLVLSSLCFAMYIVTVNVFAVKSNPAVLATGQLAFTLLFSAAGLLLETGGALPELPTERVFWEGALFTGFFIRGLYGVVQIYAQRYVSPVNVSLIFSTEIIFTLLLSPLLVRYLGTPPETVTPMKLVGCVFIIAGILLSDDAVWQRLRRGGKRRA